MDESCEGKRSSLRYSAHLHFLTLANPRSTTPLILLTWHCLSPAPALTQEMEQMEIKNLLVSKNTRFSLQKPSSNPHASYFVLTYIISTSPEKSCHIDIFLPGMIHLPFIPHDRIVYSPASGLPVMPFFPILLHKIQARLTHRASPKEHARHKQTNDVQDICELLELATTTHKVKLQDHLWLPEWFIQEAIESIPQYIVSHSETTVFWKCIGFSNL
ncbi:hypothetical protein CPB84DRAFT_532337 [Gymnopilus junonius]|uniref:Uncharacterized protein n=1 Tax=Gymnopilus junonius TaxID=109634 RepID=A0A9P5TUT4_GYMJU|nr:hypothetical protein CPB84DRAFT_532337 [Gymnopilus junonius]